MQELSLDIKAEEGFARMKGAHRPIRRSQDSCLSDCPRRWEADCMVRIFSDEIGDSRRRRARQYY